MSTTHAPIHIGALQIRFIADASQTNGGMSVFELRVPAGARVPAPHFHDEVEEVVYVTAGTLTFRAGDETRELRAGDTQVVPRGVDHHFSNLHAEEAVAVVSQSPGTIGPAYYRELAEVVNAGGPPDLAKVKAIMGRYGLQVTPPRATA